LHQWRLFSILGKEERKTKLLIVGDWLEVPAGSETKRESKFGEEEDQMLARMLTAINLSPHQVYVTNCIKCAVSADAQPKTEHVLRCFSHLQREIKAIKPEFICAMGVIPARCLLQKSQSLSHLRGKFHEYRVAENWTIPLLATYHPKFLLQNPEMKKAAWADLQLLAKKMGLMS
jgi:uracil-DNA glycosylase family 4